MCECAFTEERRGRDRERFGRSRTPRFHFTGGLSDPDTTRPPTLHSHAPPILSLRGQDGGDIVDVGHDVVAERVGQVGDEALDGALAGQL